MTSSVLRSRAPLHLSQDQLRPDEARCPICGHEQRSRLFAVQDDPAVWFLQCRLCRGASASRMPTAEALEQLRGASLGPAAGAGPPAMRPVPAQRLAEHFRRAVDPVAAGDPIDILDFGRGGGAAALGLGRLLRARGSGEVRISVVDSGGPATEVVETGLLIRVFAELDEVPPTPFDLVLASDVLEHLPYPRWAMRNLLLALRPGGLLYARTTYEVPRIRLGLLFGSRPELGYPAHLHDMGQFFWAHVLEALEMDLEFEIEESRPSTVVTTFRSDFLRTLLAHTIKAPWYVLGGAYGLVGGWEVFVRRGSRIARTLRSAKLARIDATDSAYQPSSP